jgi:hypothetical protein
MPLDEQTTGICNRSANRTNSAVAAAYLLYHDDRACIQQHIDCFMNTRICASSEMLVFNFAWGI